MVVAESSYQSQHVSCELDGRIRDGHTKGWEEGSCVCGMTEKASLTGLGAGMRMEKEQRRSSRSTQPTRMGNAVAIL